MVLCTAVRARSVCCIAQADSLSAGPGADKRSAGLGSEPLRMDSWCYIGLCLFNAQERIATPLWAFVFAMLVWGGLFTILEMRFNTLKRSLANPQFRDNRRGYSWWEWSIALPMACVTFGVLPYLSLGALGIYDIDDLPAGDVYVDVEGRFQFPVPAEGWSSGKAGNVRAG